MTMRNADAQALASCTSAMASRHVCRSPGLVDEDEARGVEVDLAIEPFLPPLQDVGTVLLRGVRTLFLRVMV